jgi:alkanesulfonate monooxygenase SsuD/methylene tetrahydromethanopterin reductase-like flavin-dependent oxidoreductase (luciferase family)
VKPGIYFDLRNPPPWALPPAQHYARSLEIAEEADRRGVGSIWTSEHHGFEDGYLPQPLTFLAAVAARTRQARLGTAVLLPALRHPVHIAEEAAIVDLLSDGRLELGLGPGYRADEFELFGADMEARYRATDECVTALRALWADGHQPLPAQQPLPLWLGYGTPVGARRAGRLGVGLLSAGPAVLEAYREGLREGGHDVADARLAVPVFWVLSDDPERAWPQVRPHYEYQWRTYRAGGRPSQQGDFDQAFAAMTSAGPGGTAPMLQVLTPEQAAAQLGSMLNGQPVEHVLFWASIAGMPIELVEEHVELVCTRLPNALDIATAGATA